MENTELSILFLGGKYELLFKELERKSLIHDFLKIFSPLTSASQNGFAELFSKNNELQAKHFFRLLNRKVRREFKKNKDHLPVVVNVVEELLSSIFSNISTSSYPGGNFLPKKNIVSIRVAVDCCFNFYELVRGNKMKESINIPELSIYRFVEQNWQDGIDAIFEVILEKYQHNLGIISRNMYAEWCFKCFGAYLEAEKLDLAIKKIPHYSSLMTKITEGFDNNCNIYIPMPQKKYSGLINKEGLALLINELLQNNIGFNKIGGFVFWNSNLDLLLLLESLYKINFHNLYEILIRAKNNGCDLRFKENEVLNYLSNKLLEQKLKEKLYNNNTKDEKKTKI